MPEVLLDILGTGTQKFAVLTLNRPTAKNAINRALSTQLAQALNVARTDSSVTCVILTGAGGCFCAGVDLKDPFFADPTLMTRDKLDSPENYLWHLQHMEIPVIAAVAGPCITGGFEIALNCDVIIAAPSAVFRDTHTVYNIVPGGGMTQLLPRIVGLQAAKWMSLTASPMDAKRAFELGLVSKV
jgi:enoyl-CoA hydratase